VGGSTAEALGSVGAVVDDDNDVASAMEGVEAEVD